MKKSDVIDECYKYDLDDDFILPPEKYCSIFSLYSLIWKSWFSENL